MSKNQSKIGEQAKTALNGLMERMSEWTQNNYAPEADIDALDTNTLKLAGELLQADAPSLGQINAYDVTAPGQSAEDVEKAKLAPHEVRFTDFIEQKRSQWNGTENGSSEADSSTYIGPAIPADQTRALFEDAHGDQQSTTETRSTPANLIRLEDPDDFIGRQAYGTLKPAMIQEAFLVPTMIRDDNYGKFLSNPAMLQLSSVRNFNAWINKYRLRRDAEILTEKTVRDEFCEEALKYVNDKYSFTRLPSALRIVFFVENPVFVYCVFGRRKDKEKTKKYLKPGALDIGPTHRRYAWAGHLFCIGRDGRNDPVELPPSTFQFKPPESLYSNTNPAASSSSSKTDTSQEGWE